MNTNTINTMLNAYNDEKAACNYLLLTTYSLQDRMLSACRYAINSGAKAQVKMADTGKDSVITVPATKDILYEGGGPNWSGRVPAFDGKIFRWNAGSEYGSWLFRVYEYFEYTNKIAGIGYVHIIYQPFTAEETLLCRAEAELYLGDREGALLSATSYGRAQCVHWRGGAAVAGLIGDMLVTPVVHLEHSTVHRLVFDALAQLIIIDNAERVEVFVVDAQGKHEVTPFPARHLLAPRHFVAGSDGNGNICLPELPGIIHTVGEWHTRIEEVQRILLLCGTTVGAGCHKSKEPHNEGSLQYQSSLILHTYLQ